VIRVLVAAVALALAPASAGAAAAAGDAAALLVERMTFVGSRAGVRDLVVEAERAQLSPKTEVALLEKVHAVVEEAEGRPGLEVTCERGELSTRTHDFLATGDVRGTTSDGRRFFTSWVRYDHQRRVAYTDAPVTITDPSGTLRGGGFRYHAREGRFRLLGGASVVQQP
jgi:LPS export ABC transporter protein LptC